MKNLAGLCGPSLRFPPKAWGPQASSLRDNLIRRRLNKSLISLFYIGNCHFQCYNFNCLHLFPELLQYCIRISLIYKTLLIIQGENRKEPAFFLRLHHRWLLFELFPCFMRASYIGQRMYLVFIQRGLELSNRLCNTRY